MTCAAGLEEMYLIFNKIDNNGKISPDDLQQEPESPGNDYDCLLYTSDAADE